MKVKQGRVLYLSAEMAVALVRDRLDRISVSVGLGPARFDQEFRLIAPDAGRPLPLLDLSAPDHREAIRRVVSVEKPALVVIDTLYKVTPGLDHNAAEDVVEVFSWLADFARSTNSALLLLDHSTKSVSAGLEAGAAIAASGSVIKGAAAAVAAHVRRHKKGYSLAVESHFGSWSDPISYRAATADDLKGPHGNLEPLGCIRSSDLEVKGIDGAAVANVFHRYAERDPSGDYCFESKRKFQEALGEAGLVPKTSRGAQQKLSDQILFGFSSMIYVEQRGRSQCILTSDGQLKHMIDQQAPPRRDVLAPGPRFGERRAVVRPEAIVSSAAPVSAPVEKRQRQRTRSGPKGQSIQQDTLDSGLPP